MQYYLIGNIYYHTKDITYKTDIQSIYIRNKYKISRQQIIY